MAPERRGVLLVDTVAARPSRFADAPLLHLRGRIAQRVRALYPPGDAALVEALVLARRESLDRDLYETFVRAGLAHLLAISGLHVGLLAFGWVFLLRAARVPPRLVFPLAAAGVVGYVLLIGAPPSAVRAAAMALAYLLARELGRPSAPADLFALAAVLILLFDPPALLEPGFQLSFAGAASAMYAGAASRAWWRDRGPTWSAVATGLAVSAATFLGTLPFTLVHFGQATAASVVSNLAAVPLLGLLMPALFASVALAPLPGLAGVPADAAVALLASLRTVAEVSAALPWALVEIPPLGWPAALGLLFLVWVWMAAVRGPEARPRAIVAAGVAASWLLLAPAAPRLWPGGRPLEIVALDVGQGDALAVRTPAGRWLLVDAGPGTRFGDAGARVVAPYLRARGARSLTALILTHPDADHIGGAPSVLERVAVRRVLDPGYVRGSELYARTLEAVARGEVELLLPRAGGWVSVDGVGLLFLAPTDSTAVHGREPNDASLWFVLRYGEFTAAFTGDAPEAIEWAAARAAGPVTFLKVSHHGSATATGEEALSVLRPRVAVISAGRRNRYGHPHPLVLDRLARAGAELRRTDLEGTIRVEAWPSSRVRVTSVADPD